jgi:multiple sugar transport system permease protein
VTTTETVPVTEDSVRVRRRSSSERTQRLVVTAGLAVTAVYFLLPVAWLAIAATKDTSALFGSFGLALEDPRPLANLRDLFAFSDGIYLRWMLNSLLYAGGGALAATLLAGAAGYALAKYRFRGREGLFNVVLGGVLVPATVLGLPLYLMLSKLGLANTYWAVLLPSMVSPFGVYLSRIYAEAAVPDELIEAARVDGAGEITIFRRISLRIMTPALVTVFLFQFVGVWNNYFLPLVMLSDDRLYPITLGLVTWQGFADRQPVLFQMMVVGAFVSTVPLVIATAVLQRYWQGGLTQGSVKG